MATLQLHRMEASLETEQRIHISLNLVVMEDLLCWVPGQGIVWPMEHGMVSGQYVKARLVKTCSCSLLSLKVFLDRPELFGKINTQELSGPFVLYANNAR